MIGHFGNGRIEEFLDCRPLSTAEAAIPSVAKRIAKKLSDFHSILVEEEKKPQLFCTLRSMLAIASSIKFTDALKQKTLDGINFETLEKEVVNMENLCESIGLPTVYAHNDLLSGRDCTAWLISCKLGECIHSCIDVYAASRECYYSSR